MFVMEKITFCFCTVLQKDVFTVSTVIYKKYKFLLNIYTMCVIIMDIS